MEKEKIKLLLVVPFFYPHRGGSQKYAEEIYANMMQGHPNFTVDVLCYNSDNAPKYEEYRGFRIYRVPCFTFIPARFLLPNPILLTIMLIKLARNHYNFVNTHIRFFDPTWWVWIYAKCIGAKSIFTGHVAIHPVHQKRLVACVSKIVDLTIASFSLKFYNYITFTNTTAQKFFQKTLKVKKSSHIVYGGVDTSYFQPTNKKGRVLPKLEQSVSDNTVLVAYVGRLIWTKGVTYLYEAIKSIANKYNVLFVLGGPGELEALLREQIRKDSLDHKVLLTGDLSYSQVRDLLSMSDIFVNPSHHNEGFPNTVLEAGSAGCYVIATDNAGTWEVLINGETGALIPQKDVPALTDAIEWALSHENERQDMAIKFREHLVKSFDWNVISKQLYSLLVKWKM